MSTQETLVQATTSGLGAAFLGLLTIGSIATFEKIKEWREKNKKK